MLPDQLRELIAAYADGDLSPQRQQAAERLLSHSDEARSLLADLQSDSSDLQDLPRCPAPFGFAEKVLERLPPVAARCETRKSAIEQLLSRRLPWSSVAALAAATLVAVGLGTWFATKPRERSGGDNSIVVRSGRPTTDWTITKNDVAPPASAPVPSPTPAPPPTSVVKIPPAPTKSNANERPVTAPSATELTSPPSREYEPIHVVLPQLPLPLTIRSVNTPEIQEKLAAEFARGTAHRIDLFCRDSSRGLERLQAALRQHGMRVLVDGMAAELQKRTRNGSYVIYCEDLSVQEWMRVFRTLANIERKAEAQTPSEAALTQAVLMPLNATDQKELTSMLGFDPLLSKSRNRSGSGIDLRKALSEGTADQVSQSIGKSEAGKSPKSAIVVLPQRGSPAASKEIRQFSESAGERRPGTVAVMLFLRMSN